jgi:hypothetical protein
MYDFDGLYEPGDEDYESDYYDFINYVADQDGVGA